jgi:hypothetical protein
MPANLLFYFKIYAFSKNSCTISFRIWLKIREISTIFFISTGRAIATDLPSAGHVTHHQLIPSSGLSAAASSRSPSRRVWMESSFVSGGKADLLPTNFGHVNNSSENNEEEYEDMTEEEIIIGEVTYSDEPMRSRVATFFLKKFPLFYLCKQNEKYLS